MDTALAVRIEKIGQQAAAASLGLACAFAASTLLGGALAQPVAIAAGLGLGGLMYLATARLLAPARRDSALHVRVFDVRTIEPEEAQRPQLLLTHRPQPLDDHEMEEPLLLTELHTRDDDQHEPLLLTELHAADDDHEVEEALVLDDVLAQLGPDSRVVRLFDRNAMPTPAQLKSRIDAHLGRGARNADAPDASQALHDALAELRRSIG